MTTLYRLYDNAGELLYIGIAEHWPSRMKQHAREKAWWDDVAATKFEKHNTREAAEEAERFAIKTERPLYNVAHAGKKAPAPWAPRILGKVVTYGTVAAFGLNNGKCPIGRVVEVRRTQLDLDLFSFSTFEYGYDTATIDYHRIVDLVVAKPMSRAKRKARHGVWSLTGKAPWDIDPLAEFQTDWKRR